MTCKELRWYFEDHVRDAEVRSARGAVVEHISTCAECSRFVAEHRDLGRNLRLVRESAPSVSESADASVVQSYRAYVTQQRQKRAKGPTYQICFASGWTWSAIAAVVLLVFASWVFSERKPGTTTAAATAHQSIPVPNTKVVAQDSPAPAVGTAGHRQTMRLRPHSGWHPAAAPVRLARSLPDGFHSLMYCDALSCPEAMDMIRVQLPTTAMPGEVSGFMPASGSVTADVLVGPDGVARGIRFEEIEF